MSIWFITGANGVGKTALVPYLQRLLPEDKYEVRDFDERGVPAAADKMWRVSETLNWLGKKNDTKTLVVCGFVKIEDLGSGAAHAHLILLDADGEVIRSRLVGRYSAGTEQIIGKPIEKFIDDALYSAKKLKHSFEQAKLPIVNTNNSGSADVAREVARIIQAV